jgi:hypothetical protein
MKYKIGFKLDWLEMIFILIIVFVAGIFVFSQMENKFIYIGLLIISAGIILLNKRVKLPLKDNKSE